MICLAVATTFSGQVLAQGYTPTPVTISKDKVKIGGNVYYSHVVLERQTVFSICKAYGVTQEELYEANPDLRKEGLKKNQILNIPVKDAPQKVDQGKTEESPADYTVYTAKWYDDIESVARKFGTTPEVIMQYNGMESRILGKKQKIKIPKDPSSVIIAEKKAEPVKENPVQTQEEESALPVFHHGKAIQTAVLLPLNGASDRFTMNADFYSGVLLAAKDLKDEGINTEIETFDISSGAIPSGLDTKDIVIGPISKTDIEGVLAKCPSRTSIVSPLEPKAASLLASHENLLQAPTATDYQYEDMVSWIKKDLSHDDRIILVVEKQAEETEGVTKVTQALNKAGLRYSIVSYNVKQGRTISGTFTETMTARGANRVIIAPAESAVFVNDAVRNLILMSHKKYDVVLYSVAKIRSTPNLDIEDLHKLNLHVSASYTVNYDSERTKRFILAYRALYETEPNSFAFMGYDTAYSLLSTISRYGRNWNSQLEGIKLEGLQSDFLFNRKGSGYGLENTAIRRTVYNPDFTVTLVQ